MSACKSATCAAGFDKVEFAHDGEGHRTQLRTTSAAGAVATTDFRYQADAIVEEQLTDATHAGVVVRRYVVDESGSVVKLVIPAGEPDAGTYLPTWNGHGDALNLSRLNADGTLTLANSYSYTSWGAPTTATANGIPDLGFRFLYVGEFDVQWDNAFGLGLQYMHARHYSPALGRFLQPDPTAEEDNLFGYASDNPVTELDPDGTCFIVCVIIVGALLFGAMEGAAAAANYAIETPRDRWSSEGFRDSAVGGAVSGAVAGAVPGVGRGVARTVVKILARVLSKVPKANRVLSRLPRIRPKMPGGVERVTRPYRREIVVKKGKLRIAPVGNQWSMRPHDHFRRVGPSGKVVRDQGMERHRPWAVGATDKTWRDRFR